MLTQKLRRLRLGRAADAVEAHHQQALKDKLGYLEFLEHLVDWKRRFRFDPFPAVSI